MQLFIIFFDIFVVALKSFSIVYLHFSEIGFSTLNIKKRKKKRRGFGSAYPVKLNVIYLFKLKTIRPISNKLVPVQT